VVKKRSPKYYAKELSKDQHPILLPGITQKGDVELVEKELILKLPV
jgi:hypothetical protein